MLIVGPRCYADETTDLLWITTDGKFGVCFEINQRQTGLIEDVRTMRLESLSPYGATKIQNDDALSRLSGWPEGIALAKVLLCVNVKPSIPLASEMTLRDKVALDLFLLHAESGLPTTKELVTSCFSAADAFMKAREGRMSTESDPTNETGPTANDPAVYDHTEGKEPESSSSSGGLPSDWEPRFFIDNPSRNSIWIVLYDSVHRIHLGDMIYARTNFPPDEFVKSVSIMEIDWTKVYEMCLRFPNNRLCIEALIQQSQSIYEKEVDLAKMKKETVPKEPTPNEGSSPCSN